MSKIILPGMQPESLSRRRFVKGTFLLQRQY